MGGLNFENIFLVGCMYNTIVKGRLGKESMFFNNGTYYVYDREIAYFENDILMVHPLTKQLGLFISHSHSKAINKIISICKEHKVEFDFIPYVEPVLDN